LRHSPTPASWARFSNGICDRFVFVQKDAARVSWLRFADTLGALTREAAVAGYLGQLVVRAPGAWVSSPPLWAPFKE